MTVISRAQQHSDELYAQLYARRGQVTELARDRWPDILERSGLSADYLRRGRPGPCPLCGGRDRYTFDDKYGDGDYYCRGCGPGKGLKLLMSYHDWDWLKAVDEVLTILQDPQAQRIFDEKASMRFQQRAVSDLTQEVVAERREKLKRLWSEAAPVERGDPVDLYLRARVPGLEEIPSVVRFHPSLPYYWSPPPGDPGTCEFLGKFPAMLAQVEGEDGRCVNLHRTWLTPAGEKASLFNAAGDPVMVKKLCQGTVRGGSQAITLARDKPRHLGVAEGIETALAASVFARVGTWSLISTSGMRNFIVPDWVEVLTIFADNDEPDWKGRRPGFDAAHALAQREDIVSRVKARSLRVNVRAPSSVGMDIADLLIGIHSRRAS